MKDIDTNELMKMLSNMDKKDLEKGISQLSKALNSSNSNQIINELKKCQSDNK